MTRRRVAALLAVGLLPLAAAPAVAGAPDLSDRVPQAAAQVRILDTSSPFSPNGDGHQDRVAVRYRLAEHARVSVQVKHRGKTVLRTTPKAVRAGKRSFRWDGARPNGRHVADGRYRVVVHAAAHGTTRTDSTAVVVRTRPTRLNAGGFELSSDTVYPDATVIDDVVVGNFWLTKNAGKKDTWGKVGAARVQILDQAGHIVSVEPVTPVAYRAFGIEDQFGCGPCGRFTWDGRDANGVRQAPGDYRLRVIQGRDSAGNTRILTGTRTVTVSSQQLEAHITTVDYTAAGAPWAEIPNNSCYNCTRDTCSPSLSSRYPGGVTFDMTRPGCGGSGAYFTTPIAGRRTPYDSFQVTATGGPSVPGETASAQLLTGVAPGSPAVGMTGDTTASSGLQALAPNSEVFPSGWPLALIWRVNGATGSYDVASFRVEIHTYVPAA